MFTGIIRETGNIVAIDQKDGLTVLTIECPAISANVKKGDSVAVDGSCLTVVALDPTTFTVQAIPETLACTIIPTYRTNQLVNLETPLKVGDELHGHMVQGHIDFVGTVTKVKSDPASTVLTIAFPLDQAKYLAFKGSVTINGVSLTISLLHEESFEVSLIPETLSTTNLKSLAKGSPVNIEVDLIARYLDSLLQDKAKETTYSFLKERNLI
jgi:riboflavin synthase